MSRPEPDAADLAAPVEQDQVHPLRHPRPCKVIENSIIDHDIM